jgi:hypothetical protein
MVFMKVINYISGIFSTRKSIYRYVEKSELESIVSTVINGFDTVNLRVDSIDSDLTKLKNNDSKIYKRLDELQSKYDSLVENYSDVKMDDNSINLVKLEFDNKLRDLEKKIMIKLDKSVLLKTNPLVETGAKNNVETNVVAKETNDVATDLSQSTIVFQQPKEKIVEVKPKVINTVFTEKSIKGMVPPSLHAVFNILLNIDTRLSYKQLAFKLDKKEATARSYVNDLRKYGVSIEEESGPNGRKYIRLSKRIRQEHIIPE